MAAGDIKIAYGSSVDLTVTSLHSLAASATYVGGWESAVIDNTSDLFDDFIISGLVKTAASNNQIGSVFVYVVPMIADDVWPDVFDGTESAESWTSVGVRDAIAKLGAVIAVTADASRSYSFAFSVLGKLGFVPPKFALFISGNAATSTNAQFAADTNIVTKQGIYHTVAQS
jgi:hypothetical protein